MDFLRRNVVPITSTALTIILLSGESLALAKGGGGLSNFLATTEVASTASATTASTTTAKAPAAMPQAPAVSPRAEVDHTTTVRHTPKSITRHESDEDDDD